MFSDLLRIIASKTDVLRGWLLKIENTVILIQLPKELLTCITDKVICSSTKLLINQPDSKLNCLSQSLSELYDECFPTVSRLISYNFISDQQVGKNFCVI